MASNTTINIGREIAENSINTRTVKKRHPLVKSVRKYWDLYLIFIPVVAYFIIFKYIPMYGVQIAFRDFSPSSGIWHSDWVWFENFERFLRSYQFTNTLKNTVLLSFYQLIASFPAPVILALLINEMGNKQFKSLLQTITYAPHFLSTVVLVGMLEAFLAPGSGVVNNVIQSMGGTPVSFMAEPSAFRHVYVWSEVWKNAGWGSIIYLSTLTSIDIHLYEAATIDGANRWGKLRHITLPLLIPTAVIILIMDSGKVMNLGFEKAFLMQNSLNLNVSEVISTYVYKMGIQGMQYSYSTAVDLFNSVINLILLLSVNKISKSMTQSSLW
ncbi:MAG: ABC transporter permease subunit [Bacillota bacterium]|nr:ABC transporter permease subunit [Bacillota bacterium]